MQDFLVTAGFAEASGNESGGQRIVDLPHSISNNGTPGNYLSATNPTSLTFTQTDTMIFGMWINLVVAAQNGFLSKLEGVDPKYYISTDGGGSFDFAVLGLTNGEVASASPLSTATKYFCLAWIDPASHTVNIQINGGTVESSSYTPATISMGVGDFVLADDGTAALVLNGKLDEIFVCKNPSSLSAALTALNSTVYNSGSGVRYENLATSTKTIIGLQNWWGVDESSGTRFDLHGSVNLTETGTLTVNTALVS